MFQRHPSCAVKIQRLLPVTGQCVISEGSVIDANISELFTLVLQKVYNLDNRLNNERHKEVSPFCFLN